MSQSKKLNLSSFIVITSGIISICIGILVILGWHLHISQIIQVKSSFAPMQYNTAFSFILLGLSLLLISASLPNLSITCSVIVGIISFFTLLEYILNINLGIDEFLFKHYITIPTPYPGRMATNTAFCFLFISCGLTLVSIRHWLKNAHILLGIIASIPFAISSIALLGYLINLQSVSSWTDSSRMAIHTASTLTIISLGLFTLALKQSPKTIQNTLLEWLPIPIIYGTGTVNIILWLAISSSNTHHSILPNIILITGIIVSLLMGYTIHLLQKEKKYVIETREISKELKKAYLEIKETRDQLLQAAKLAAMGELAAGIAHELTQPLQGIKGFSETIRIDLDKILGEDKLSEDEVKKYALRNSKDIEVILQQTSRMSTILSSIRDFARSSNLEKEQVNINKVIEASLVLFSDNFKINDVSLDLNLFKDLPNILGNTNQLEQVFINLIGNSFDAMNSVQNKKELSICSKLSSDKNHVNIEIKDSGIGMDEETQKKIFNPFFTTKKEGTGLGMSISDRIIRDHNAYITIQSKANSGSKFIISFPITKDENSDQ